MLSLFPLDVLDEIWDLIESVSKGFPTYSCLHLLPCALTESGFINVCVDFLWPAFFSFFFSFWYYFFQATRHDQIGYFVS